MQYEYLKVPAKEFTNLSGRRINVEALNKLGAEGWELVAFTFSLEMPAWGYFKREKIVMPIQSMGELVTLRIEFEAKVEEVFKVFGNCACPKCQRYLKEKIVDLKYPLDNHDTKSVG